ncbi:hypothetical protein VNI00_013969 [Paramarasmius palmivorus]|uniref:Ricin B lectin domain-containing protein n=1 Tax=Paramarasmius palmivorus TaxID=297713 RepID=A0AAW0BVN6_9AGAR
MLDVLLPLLHIRREVPSHPYINRTPFKAAVRFSFENLLSTSFTNLFAMAPTEIVQSGQTYRIINASSGTLLDLSQDDNRSIIGWPRNDGANQRWTVTWAGDGWTFKSVSSGMYLGIADNAVNGVPLIAKQDPTIWHIWHDQMNNENYRVYIPNTVQNWDLYDYGSKRPGDPVTLWTAWNGVHQTWKFEPV